MTSLVAQKEWEFHKMGIDFSSAFDTIKRKTILELLRDACCSEDEVRMVRFFLSNTKIKVKVNDSLSLDFQSTKGGPQGECISGCLFTLSLAGALYHVRAVTMRPTPPIQESGMSRRVNTRVMKTKTSLQLYFLLLRIFL